MNIKNIAVAFTFAILPSVVCNAASANAERPWDHGKLTVSADGRYLCHADSTPFFWMGETAWLLPERLNRDEAAYYLSRVADAGFNVVQIQTINDVPAINIYGSKSMPGTDFVFDNIDHADEYGYWDNVDHIVKTAGKEGIYVGMVCIWGGLVKAGKMDVEQARRYGEFLGKRYRDCPNIVWIIGGDIRGDVKPEVWTALAESIKANDPNHLMTFHPFGRTLSARWFNDAPWLDFNMFQSGHRRYGQRKGDGDYSDPSDNEEDNWRYVDEALAMNPRKPVLDGEPSYEGIPQGLHDPKEPRWTDRDVRRYAYWSCFAGAAGHTYGNNSIMQFYRPGLPPAYGAEKSWTDALDDAGLNQMKHLKRLMTTFDPSTRRPDNSVIIGETGERYDRLTALRGNDYLLVYNYSGRDMEIDLTKISGTKKHAWYFNPVDGQLTDLGEYDGRSVRFKPGEGEDVVLIVTDSGRKMPLAEK